MSKHPIQIAVRVSEKTLERLDNLVERAPWEATFGSSIRRSDVIREAIRRGLDDIEKEFDQQK